MKEKKPVNVQIGARIKAAREASGYTQERFAEQIDVSIQYISDLERGVVGTSISTLMKICSVLHVSSDYILFGHNFGGEAAMLESRLRTLSPEQLSIISDGIQVILNAFNSKKNK